VTAASNAVPQVRRQVLEPTLTRWPQRYNVRFRVPEGGLALRPDLLKLASNLAAREERFALVTVVRREPPSSARVGDVAVVTEKGDYHGWVGGGCTRSTVLRESLRAIADGEPRLLSLSPDAGNGRPGLISLPMTCNSGGTVEIYVEPVLPAARLLLFGSSPTVRVLARIGHAMGYRIDVVDPNVDKAAFPDAERVLEAIVPEAVPRGAHVLVATMGEGDLEAIETALARAPAYLGVIASPKRFAQLRDALLARGVARELLEGIAAPAGLDIGARSPEEIALSIMAQIVERRRRAEQPPQAESTPARQPAREAVDPVCGMSVTVAGARHTAEALGVTYYFCCAGCRTKFLSDTARFVAAAAKAR
jgi:xanthine dehydrogenase accessory factor